jgi:hypothetical protein
MTDSCIPNLAAQINAALGRDCVAVRKVMNGAIVLAWEVTVNKDGKAVLPAEKAKAFLCGMLRGATEGGGK